MNVVVPLDVPPHSVPSGAPVSIHLVRLAGFLATILMGSVTCVATPPLDQIVSALVARRTQIQSADVVFQYSSMSIGDNLNGHPWPWKIMGEDRAPTPAQILLIDGEYLMRWPGHLNGTVSRRDLHAEYGETPQPDESIDKRLMVHGARVNSVETLYTTSVPFRVFLAGTIVSRSLPDYLRSHKENVSTAEADDGAIRLELRVPQSDLEKVGGAQAIVANITEAILTIEVDPQKNWSVRRLDYSTPDGLLYYRILAEDFFECSDGFWAPHYFYEIGLTSLRPVEYSASQYHIHHFERVNSGIDLSELTLSVPAGAVVHDLRPGRPEIEFEVQESFDLSQLNRALRAAAFPHISPGSSAFRPWIILTNLFILALFVMYIMLRRVLKRGANEN